MSRAVDARLRSDSPPCPTPSKRAQPSAICQARAAYLPTLNFQGEGGEIRAYGKQNLLPDTYAGPIEIWNTSLNLR